MATDDHADDAAAEHRVICAADDCSFSGAYNRLTAACAAIAEHNHTTGHTAHIPVQAPSHGDNDDSGPWNILPVAVLDDADEDDTEASDNDGAAGGRSADNDSDTERDTMWLRIDLAPGTQLGWAVHDAADLAEQFFALSHGDAIHQVLPVSNPSQVLPDLSRAANADDAAPPSLTVQVPSAPRTDETAQTSDAAVDAGEPVEIAVSEVLTAIMGHAASPPSTASKAASEQRVRDGLDRVAVLENFLDVFARDGAVPVQVWPPSDGTTGWRLTWQSTADSSAVRPDGGTAPGTGVDAADDALQAWHALSAPQRDCLLAIAAHDEDVLTGRAIHREIGRLRDDVINDGQWYQHLTELARRGLISKAPAAEDRRANAYALTDRGHALIAAHAAHVTALNVDAATQRGGDTE